MKGVIYILTNPSFPQYVKIGYASDLSRRLGELNRSEALPYAFRAYATYDTDKRLTDKALHVAYEGELLTDRRERMESSGER